MSLLDDVARASALLAKNGRVSLRGLRRQFDLDDETLDELVEELVDVMQVARREGNVLVWTNGDARPDTVVVSPQTRRLVQGVFVTHDRGLRELKGIPERSSIGWLS